MSGPALLAMWNDVAAAVEDEYETWHAEVHLPERLAIEGFREARRYEAAPAGPDAGTERYFTVYDIAGPEVLRDPAYRALLDRADPITERMMEGFRAFTRGMVPCVDEVRQADGGVAVTWRFENTALDVGRLAEIVSGLVHELGGRPGVVAAYGGAADRAAAAASWERSVRERRAADRGFDALVVAETRNPTYAEALLSQVHTDTGDVHTGRYRLSTLRRA